MNYLHAIEMGHKEAQEFGAECSRMVYLADYVLDFTTYDDGMSELFAEKMLEVCEAINEGRTHDYIKDPERYRWYLLMCNMPFLVGRIEWGTSIRGAWWDNEIELDGSCLWQDGKQMGKIKFTQDEWKKFIAAMLEFAKGAK